ncbi:hypothetical protein ACHAQA_002038 [Verticillium albo-atrum]
MAASNELVESHTFNNNWDPDGLELEHVGTAVQQIHLCALRNNLNEGDEAGEPPTNHWTLCLQLSPGSSVMLDMAPGYGSDGLRGKIEISSLGEHPYTDETLRLFSFDPARNIKVADVVRLIDDRGRDAFNFSPEWEGCRHWLSIIVADLEDVGYVPKGSSATATTALLQYWRNPEGSEPRVMRDGMFRG